MKSSALPKAADTAYFGDDKPVVLLFDPKNNSIDQSFIDSSSELRPSIKLDFHHYDMNRKDSLYYVYLDLKYYAIGVAEEVGNDRLKKFVNAEFKRGFRWAKAGSQVPISNLLRGFCREFHEECNVHPWIILANIDVPTELNHATIGSIVFDVVTDPMADRVILTCTPESWTSFEKGHDIFARIASRLRSCTKRL